MINSLRRFLLFISIALLSAPVFAQSFKSGAELHKNAERDFKEENYAAALPLYSQLLSLNQKDAKLNYRYGVCLLMADKDKTSAYNYLEFASHDAKTEDDVYLYMGMSLQLKYRFDDAINAYNEYIKRAGGGAVKKFNPARMIETCQNAKELLKTRTGVVVKSSKEVSANAIYSAYDLPSNAGKLLATPEIFLSSIDKRKMLSPMMFLANDGQAIYFTSYGNNGANGKDIYTVRKLPSGGWGKPQNLGTVVNTKYDEDYPYMDADGRTLYFTSKGHNSMGGYDVFKTTYDAFNDTWTEPENLGAGINSPDDDIFYMPVSDGEAQFASSKETPEGILTIYTIEVAKSSGKAVAVHGKFQSIDQPLRTDAKIFVLRKSDNGLVATARTDQKTGTYDFFVPAGDEYEIVVQGGGYTAHAENFSLPPVSQHVVIAQQINLNRNNGKEELEIRNEYIQSDSASVIASVAPQNMQVIKDEFAVDQESKTQLQPFKVNGKVVYATMPAILSTPNQTSPPVDTAAASIVNDQQANAEEKNSVEDKQAAPDSAVKADDLQRATADDDELKNKEEAGVMTNDSAYDQEDTVADESNDKKQNIYKPNISDKDLVKLAYSDANDINTEAKVLTNEAAVEHAVAVQKDSISKSQLIQMALLLKSGDQATARDIGRQSQLNEDSAQQASAQAADFDEQATERQAEAQQAFADADDLRKNTMNKSSSPIASNKSKSNEQSDTDNEKNASVTSQNNIAMTDTTNQAMAANTVNTGYIDSDDDQLKNDSACDAAPVLVSASGETTKGNDTAINDVKPLDDAKNESIAAEEKNIAPAASTELSSAAVIPDTNQSASATTAPATSQEATARAAELEKQSNYLSLQSDTLKEEAQKSTDPATVSELMKEAKSNEKQAKEKSAEAETELVLAQELKKTEDMNTAGAKEIITPSDQQTIMVTTATKVKTDSVSSPIVNSTPSNTIEPKPSDNISAATQNNNVSEKKTSDVITAAQSPIENGAATEKVSTSSLAPTEESNQMETNSVPASSANAAEILKDMPVEEINSYKEYIQDKNESNVQAKQAEAIQAKIESMPSSAQRDQLAQQANNLNLQSIKTWQAAQTKLNAINADDPGAEAKLKEAFPEASMNVPQTAAVNEPIVQKQQSDTLMSQAVTHRVAAENAADKPTENDELKKTEQLIIESKGTSPEVAGNTPAAETLSTETNDNTVKTASPNSVTAEKENEKPVAAENKSVEPASKTNASSNEAPPMLSENTLHVDEDAVFSVSSTPVYSAANPVPMNPDLPEGLVFKVQIGAFHKPLSPDAFKNVQPLSGETTRPGWIRYCVGMFRTFEPANVVKMNMRESGYRDAFVVAYYNGKRIGLNDAYAVINRSGNHEKELYAVASEKETHHLSSLNINAADYTLNNDADAASFYGTTANTTATDGSLVEYAVQVGVYKSSTVPKKLQTLIPLNSESYKSHLYRFTTGRFALRDQADSLRKVAVGVGVKDAFVVIYKGGRRVGENYALLTMNKPNKDVPASAKTLNVVNDQTISYKVQVGAYRSDFSEAKIAALKAFYKAEIKQSVNSKGLHLIYAGSFADYNEALILKNQIVANGTKDAFVTAFSGDTKVSIQQALHQTGK